MVLNTPVEIVVNGEFISIDASPVFDKSYLLVPIRALSSLGLSYEWHPSTGKVRIYNHLQGVFLEITQDSRTALRDGKTLEMTIPAQNRNGRTMVPLRFISEAFDYKVQYETIRKMVFISSPRYEFKKEGRSPLAHPIAHSIAAGRVTSRSCPSFSLFSTDELLTVFILHFICSGYP
ncbi:copper amine oxidase N-terminal domain-containing protein [Paenibacillus sp. YSY-4.3]